MSDFGLLQIRLDANGRQINKFEERTKKLNHAEDVVHNGPDTALVLTTDNFEAAHHKHDVMMVNFYAPWCHWCKKFEPVWEKTAAELAKKYPGDERLKLGKVDCTAKASEALCIKNR